MTVEVIVRAIEERSRNHPDRVVRLLGSVGDEPLEVLIFRGFSSSTTHPTAFDPDTSVLPQGTRLDRADLLQGPLTPSSETLLVGGMTPEDLLAQASW